ncbi:MAG: hypothetical protein CL613_00720 [Aquimarina sp.]|nr:hypothetical protein [Aquimarina sp.]
MGVQNTNIKPKGNKAFAQKFNNSINPNFEIEYRMTPTMFNSNLSLITELGYYNSNNEGDYYRNHEVLINNYKTTKVDLKMLGINFGILHKLIKPSKKMDINVFAKYTGRALLNSDNAYLRIDNQGNESSLYEDFEGADKVNFTHGFTLGFSCEYQITNTNTLSFRTGYSLIGDYFNYSGAFYPLNIFDISIGYGFQL